ncbi:hypothetical protein ABFA07_019052 [Porites harrisoni]
MDSPKKEVSSAATPREVDLFAEEALEEVFETIDSLRAQFDQLQIHCEKLAAEKAQVDQLLIDKETEYQRTKELLQEDVSNLRKVNLQLLASQKAFAKGETGPVDLGSLGFVVDSEKLYQEKVEAEAKVDALQLKLLEKDKQLSSLEWQLVDAEATIASLQAERDRLALELDCAVGKEQDDLHALGAVGDTSSNDPLEHLEYGLVESGYVDDMPVRRVRKQPRRHLSDLTSRGSSHVEDFGAVFIGNSSFSDYDVPHLAEKEYNGLGGLKRANNFSDINNLDEHEVFDRRASEAALNSVGKWESFDEPDGDLSLSGEELSSVPPSPNDVRKLSKDSSIKEAENAANNEDYLEQNGVRIPSESPSAEGASSNIHINNDSTSNSTKSRPDSRRSSSVLVTQDSSPLKTTRRTASDASTNKKLQEYHKWKVAGCKGDPPAKLKISPC